MRYTFRISSLKLCTLLIISLLKPNTQSRVYDMSDCSAMLPMRFVLHNAIRVVHSFVQQLLLFSQSLYPHTGCRELPVTIGGPITF